MREYHITLTDFECSSLRALRLQYSGLDCARLAAIEAGDAEAARRLAEQAESVYHLMVDRVIAISTTYKDDASAVIVDWGTTTAMNTLAFKTNEVDYLGSESADYGKY